MAKRNNRHEYTPKDEIDEIMNPTTEYDGIFNKEAIDVHIPIRMSRT